MGMMNLEIRSSVHLTIPGVMRVTAHLSQLVLAWQHNQLRSLGQPALNKQESLVADTGEEGSKHIY
jgi:hypothetical protein